MASLGQGGGMVSENRIEILDRFGILLSLVCAIHCALAPFAVFSLPIFFLIVEESWLVHGLLALFILPTALLAWYLGYRHHKDIRIFWLGLPGLAMVCLFPVLAEGFHVTPWIEAMMMIPGSALLIAAHWLNRKSCRCPHVHD